MAIGTIGLYLSSYFNAAVVSESHVAKRRLYVGLVASKKQDAEMILRVLGTA